MLGVIGDAEYHASQQVVAVFFAKIPETNQVFASGNYCYSVKKSMIKLIQKSEA